MKNLMEQGARWLADKQQAFASVPVIYRRGERSVSLLAVPAQSQGEQDVEGGAQVGWQQRDWIVVAKDLVIDGQRITPKRGDRIEQQQEGVAYVHEVMPPPGGEDAWRWSDLNRVRLRIHTKQVRMDR